jgi:hypothetical protein|tara:strand:- start:113 stop:307 length:195 start_codon:yes stop_codon:yes gene_type:complete
MQPKIETEKQSEKIEILEKYQEKRIRCLVYTRVMGYHRPVESFNIGKKGEHIQRQHFIEKSILE